MNQPVKNFPVVGCVYGGYSTQVIFCAKLPVFEISVIRAMKVVAICRDRLWQVYCMYNMYAGSGRELIKH